MRPTPGKPLLVSHTAEDIRRSWREHVATSWSLLAVDGVGTKPATSSLGILPHSTTKPWRRHVGRRAFAVAGRPLYGLELYRTVSETRRSAAAAASDNYRRRTSSTATQRSRDALYDSVLYKCTIIDRHIDSQLQLLKVHGIDARAATFWWNAVHWRHMPNVMMYSARGWKTARR